MFELLLIFTSIRQRVALIICSELLDFEVNIHLSLSQD